VTPTLPNVLIARLWAAGACALMWLLTLPLRRRSLAALLASVVLTGTAASIGAIFGFIHAMLLPTHEQVTVIVVAAAAGVVGALAAGAAARRLTKDRQVLRTAVAELGQGLIPRHDGRRLTSELEQVRHELSLTAQGLAESRARERSLESARRELVAWVSHDLRTPLAGLRAMSEALEDGVVDEPELYYKQIHSAVDRLSGMVDDLFDLSRIQAGSFSRETDAIALDDLVSDCLAALEPLAAAQGVRRSGRMAGAAGGGRRQRRVRRYRRRRSGAGVRRRLPRRAGPHTARGASRRRRLGLAITRGIGERRGGICASTHRVVVTTPFPAGDRFGCRKATTSGEQ